MRNVDPFTDKEELENFVAQFGTVMQSRLSYPFHTTVHHFNEFVTVCFLSKYHQALIEMESIASAEKIVEHCKTTPVKIKGKNIFFNYSRSQSIFPSKARDTIISYPNIALWNPYCFDRIGSQRR